MRERRSQESWAANESSNVRAPDGTRRYLQPLVGKNGARPRIHEYALDLLILLSMPEGWRHRPMQLPSRDSAFDSADGIVAAFGHESQRSMWEEPAWGRTLSNGCDSLIHNLLALSLARGYFSLVWSSSCASGGVALGGAIAS